MTEHMELLAMILPPQGRLALATADSGPLPPALVLALEHKAATGSQTVAARLDRDRARQLYHALGDWLVAVQPHSVSPDPSPDQPATGGAAQVMVKRPDGGVEVLTDGTVQFWLQSNAEGMDL